MIETMLPGESKFLHLWAHNVKTPERWVGVSTTPPATDAEMTAAGKSATAAAS